MGKGSRVNERIIIAGRSFVPVGESTLEHDNYFFKLRRSAGLESATLHAGESFEAFANRLLATCLASDAFFEMLGTLIVPEGTAATDWTPEMCAETGRFLAKLVDPEDKQRVHNLTVSLLIDFFAEGISSLETSRTSSSEPAAGAEPTTEPTNLIPSDSGAGSSGSSPTIDPTNTNG